jgi:recombination protein RecA
VADGHVKKAGAWFSYGEIRLGQGRENSKVYIAEHRELFEELRTKVMISRGVIDDPNVVAKETAADDAPEETPAS